MVGTTRHHQVQRVPILGHETNRGGYGNRRGLPQWNMDGALTKNVEMIKSEWRRLEGGSYGADEAGGDV